VEEVGVVGDEPPKWLADGMKLVMVGIKVAEFRVSDVSDGGESAVRDMVWIRSGSHLFPWACGSVQMRKSGRYEMVVKEGKRLDTHL
jgi:hypothetical protein